MLHLFSLARAGHPIPTHPIRSRDVWVSYELPFLTSKFRSPPLASSVSVVIL